MIAVQTRASSITLTHYHTINRSHSSTVKDWGGNFSHYGLRGLRLQPSYPSLLTLNKAMRKVAVLHYRLFCVYVYILPHIDPDKELMVVIFLSITTTISYASL